MKYLYLKNLKKFNILKLYKLLNDSNFSFFIFYIDYSELQIYKKFFEINKFVFIGYFNFLFNQIKIIDYWKLWGNDYYVCFFFKNDFYYQIEFINNNNNIIEDYIYNGIFFNIENLYKDNIYYYDELIESMFINFSYIIFNIYMDIYLFFHNIIKFIEFDK